MRILYTAFDVVPAPKGAAVRIGNMLAALAPIAEVRGVFLGEPGDNPSAPVSGVPVDRLCAPHLPFLERAVTFAEQVVATVREWQPEVVQVRSLWDGYPLARLRANGSLDFRLVYELHGLPQFELTHHFPEVPPALLAKIATQQAYLLAQADALICPSNTHRDWLVAQGIAPERITVIHNGADTERWVPAPEVLDFDIPKLIYVGTLAPWQGLETLLEALHGITTPFSALLIGKGNPRWVSDLITRSYQLGLSHAVEVSAPLSPTLMPTLIGEAAIAVAPLDNSERNRVQGCNPIKIYEYMACGKPVVAPDLPVIREILTPEVDSLLYPPEDVDALREQLQRLLSDAALRARLGQAGRAKVVAQGQWRHAQDRLQAFYRDFGAMPAATV
jgi:glycosyltransferase involved in cell wall biosynthesis